ncbi:MAG: methyltransferase family protein [Opitutaceae bacterium]
MLLIRAIVAFLALPTMVAGVVPALLVHGSPVVPRMAAAGAVVMSPGIAFLLWCVRDFFASGRGTLAPWDPPKHLVTVGLYRFVRNPMYAAILLIVGGWGLLFLSKPLAIYLTALALLFHIRVRLFEEPWLRRHFGREWEVYSRVTGRWVPRWNRRGKHGRQANPNGWVTRPDK